MDLQTWRPAVWAAYHARALTRSARDVLLTLATFRGREGRIYPSHATLAARVGCCVRTVQAGLAAGRDAGLVAWDSGRWRRRVNRYWLAVPRNPFVARQVRRVERTLRAIVGKWRGGGEQGAYKRLMAHPPVRTVAEQVAMLLGAGQGAPSTDPMPTAPCRRSELSPTPSNLPLAGAGHA